MASTSKEDIEIISVGGGGGGDDSSSSSMKFDTSVLFSNDEDSVEHKGDEKKSSTEKKKIETVERKEIQKLFKEADERKITTLEDIQKKQALVLKLNRYNESRRFGIYLKDLGFELTAKKLNGFTIEELECVEEPVVLEGAVELEELVELLVETGATIELLSILLV